MAERDFYQTSETNLQAQESRKLRRRKAFLRNVLLFIFGAYSFFFAVFVLFALIELTQGVTAKSIVGMANAVFMAFFSIMAFVSVKREQSRAFTYSLFLFAIGFITTTIYRMAFVTDELAKADFSNFLLFSIPAGLTFLYTRLLKQSESKQAISTDATNRAEDQRRRDPH